MAGFEGKIIVVTGGSSGIGEEIIKTFLQEKAEIVNLDIKESDRGYFIKCDVSNENDVNNAYDLVIRKFRKVDVLVNNAGIIEIGEFEKFDIALIKSIFDVNVFGAMNCCKIFGKNMIENKKGKIVNIISTHSIIGKTDLDTELSVDKAVVYASSKGALLTFTKALAIEFGKYNINVNGINPGLVETEMTKNLDFEKIKERLPLKRIVAKEDIAKLVLFLASENSKNITGEIINIDAGYLAKG